ncbi:hypothetical protein KO505_03480 [Psychrosphaera sp. F3M07]|uniref:hypothetical protein n=1 Tax=Psychrosphaera sp. F3M07 TaxID=2841560 RepID=UPI001C08AB93|nr:hypothetical protein [Psychrosphaera sp. F3M07]MBU2917024.1 hypothetical protein [Psychrosphaera sp. F3M07]
MRNFSKIKIPRALLMIFFSSLLISACATTYQYQDIASEVTVPSNLATKIEKRYSIYSKKYLIELPESRHIGNNAYSYITPSECKYINSFKGIISLNEYQNVLNILRPYHAAIDLLSRKKSNYSFKRLSNIKQDNLNRLNKKRDALISQFSKKRLKREPALKLANQIKVIEYEIDYIQNALLLDPRNLVKDHREFRRSYQVMLDNAADNITSFTESGISGLRTLSNIENGVYNSSSNCVEWKPDLLANYPNRNELIRDIESQPFHSNKFEQALFEKMKAIIKTSSNEINIYVQQINEPIGLFAALIPFRGYERSKLITKALEEEGIIDKLNIKLITLRKEAAIKNK